MIEIINANPYTYSRLTQEQREEFNFSSTRKDRKLKKMKRQNKRLGRLHNKLANKK